MWVYLLLSACAITTSSIIAVTRGDVVQKMHFVSDHAAHKGHAHRAVFVAGIFTGLSFFTIWAKDFFSVGFVAHEMYRFAMLFVAFQVGTTLIPRKGISTLIILHDTLSFLSIGSMQVLLLLALSGMQHLHRFVFGLFLLVTYTCVITTMYYYFNQDERSLYSQLAYIITAQCALLYLQFVGM